MASLATDAKPAGPVPPPLPDCLNIPSTHVPASTGGGSTVCCNHGCSGTARSAASLRIPPGFSGDSGDFSPNATKPGRRLPPAHTGTPRILDTTKRCVAAAGAGMLPGNLSLPGVTAAKAHHRWRMRVYMADFQRASGVPGRLRVPVGHRVRCVTAARFMRRLPELASPPAIALPMPGRPGRHPHRWRLSRATKNPAWAGFSVAAVAIDQSISRKLRSCSERLG